MASIRRTLSPLPRPVTLRNGEACSVASPLSKSSLCTQNYQPPVGLLSSFSSFDYAFYRIQSFILGLFSKRSSRPAERQKPKRQVWRRSLVHFFICFMVGFYFGLPPLAMNLSVKHQAFSFELVPSLEKVQWFDVMPRNATPLVDSSPVNDNATLWPHVMKLELQNETSDDTLVTQSLIQDWNMTFHKLLIIVTPTYALPFQAYYLNRLAHTLKLIPPPLLWIVVDMGSLSAETANILRRQCYVQASCVQ